LQGLVPEARAANRKTILTENSEEVAVIVPIPPNGSPEVQASHIAKVTRWWNESTSEEEREAFAADLEEAHAVYCQPARFNSWE
jgi:hypothetical protein